MDQGLQEKIFVLDTSFLISFSQSHIWTIPPVVDIHSSPGTLTTTRGVCEEYGRLMCSGERDIFVVFRNIRRLLRFEEDGNMTKHRAAKIEFDEISRRTKHGTKTSSIEDKTVVNTTLEHALQGKNVTVISGDMLMVEQIDSERDLRGLLNIDIYSPQRIPVKVPSIDYLISGHAIEQIKISSGDISRFPSYLAIANRQHIGGKVDYNIIFGLYINKTNALMFPRFKDVTFVRLYLVKDLRKGSFDARSAYDVLNMRSSSSFAVYTESYPHAAICRVKNPIKPHERKLLIQHGGDISVEYFGTSIARIDDEDIGRHDKVTVGKMQEMKRKIDVYR